jgi:hypothetical protein
MSLQSDRHHELTTLNTIQLIQSQYKNKEGFIVR